jgi:hypothetical protein
MRVPVLMVLHHLRVHLKTQILSVIPNQEMIMVMITTKLFRLSIQKSTLTTRVMMDIQKMILHLVYHFRSNLEFSAFTRWAKTQLDQKIDYIFIFNLSILTSE